MGISLLAALVFSSSSITGRLCSVCHALFTDKYGAGTSRKTQSHWSARISSRLNPQYNPIITNTYGGRSLIAVSNFSTCSSDNAFLTFCGFPPLADSFEQGDFFMTLLSSAAVKISLYSICVERYTDSDILNAGSIARFTSSGVTSVIYLFPSGFWIYFLTFHS